MLLSYLNFILYLMCSLPYRSGSHLYFLLITFLNFYFILDEHDFSSLNWNGIFYELLPSFLYGAEFYSKFYMSNRSVFWILQSFNFHFMIQLAVVSHVLLVEQDL